MVDLIKLLSFKGFHGHHDHLTINLFSLFTCFDQEHKIHVTITALCHIYIFEHLVSLEFANWCLFNPSILEYWALYFIVCRINRSKSSLAQRMRFDHLYKKNQKLWNTYFFNTIFLSKAKFIIRFKIILLKCLWDAYTLVWLFVFN